MQPKKMTAQKKTYTLLLTKPGHMKKLTFSFCKAIVTEEGTLAPPPEPARQLHTGQPPAKPYKSNSAGLP